MTRGSRNVYILLSFKTQLLSFSGKTKRAIERIAWIIFSGHHIRRIPLEQGAGRGAGRMNEPNYELCIVFIQY